MSLTFAGVPLLLGDPDRELTSWIDRSLSLDDMRLFGSQPVAVEEGRQRPRTVGRAKVGLPTVNWPAAPRPKVNAVYWPSGATRWAQGLFLADGATLAKIVEAVSDAGGGLLAMDDGSNSVSLLMRMLTPRPLAETSAPTEEDLYLLPLVDARYYWQLKDVDLSLSACGSWDSVLSTVGNALGVSIHYDTLTSYYYPDEIELTRHYENAAVLLDAVAWCLGCRVVADTDGTVFLQNAVKAIEAVAANRTGWTATALASVGVGDPVDENYNILAGGRRTENLAYKKAAQVRVVYPLWHNDVTLDAPGDVYAITLDGSDYTDETEPNTVKTFYDTGKADVRSGSVPANYSKLLNLARHIACDYYTWGGAEQYDVSFAGLKPWVPNGLDDYVWWHAAVQHSPASDHAESPDYGDYRCYTRAAALPADVGVAELLHQFCFDGGTTTTTTTGEPTTTTTNTTQQPTTTSTLQPCAGTCHWTWSDADKVWTNDSDGCGLPTTTSTTTAEPTTTTSGEPTTTTSGEPTSTTTTTTAEPGPEATYVCPLAPSLTPPPDTPTTTTTTTGEPTTTTTGDPSTSTTTTSTSTTTTAAPCQCLYPAYCGSFDGECTVTDCGAAAFRTSPPECGQTTTSTTSTTTTTGDPATSTTTTPCPEPTTTTTPNCSVGCDWEWGPGSIAGSWGWVITSNGCSSGCPCAYPTSVGSPCETTHTECVTTTTVPPVNVCTGRCDWFGWHGEWHLIRGGCTLGGSITCCTCPQPSRTPGECVTESTSCIDCTATTTTQPPGPCDPTTTTGEPTTTTSTTVAPCDQKCKWQWSTGSSAWTSLSDPCPSSCPCTQPIFDGAEDCQTAETYCGNGTTTTTTTSCPDRHCLYTWTGVDWAYLPQSTDCDQASGGCGCCPPTTAGTYTNERTYSPCASTGSCPTTTSTTAGPTTTTTTTTAGPCSTLGCTWQCIPPGIFKLLGNSCDTGSCKCCYPDYSPTASSLFTCDEAHWFWVLVDSCNPIGDPCTPTTSTTCDPGATWSVWQCLGSTWTLVCPCLDGYTAVPPTNPCGDPLVVDEGEKQFGTCLVGTTTTAAPTTTTTVEPTTTSTGEPATTTTTASACTAQDCQWYWDGAIWGVTVTNCPSCFCCPPYWPGSTPGDVTSTNCAASAGECPTTAAP